MQNSKCNADIPCTHKIYGIYVLPKSCLICQFVYNDIFGQGKLEGYATHFDSLLQSCGQETRLV